MKPLEALKQYFGYDSFRQGQEEIINSILDGKNVLAILPTGGGKSLCYQIPALLSKTFAVVISPLIALMKDQVDSLNKNEQIAAYINSTLDYRSTEKVLRMIESGDIKLLYLSPEKIESSFFSEKIKNLSPEYIFIDEAHCISEWGHNFRPSYRKIKEFINHTGIKKVSAFTATATEEVRDDIIEQLCLSQPIIFIKGFERSNLSLNVINTTNKKEKILNLISHKTLPAIIYTATRKNCEEVASYLTLNKINAAYYHAGLQPEIKRMIQDDFMHDKIKVICATNAFGMGIDKSDIRTVIHYNMPGSLENYYQEIGRAGRDGKESKIFLLYNEKDKLIQKFFIDSSFPTRGQIELVYDIICNYGKVAVGMTNSKPILLDTGMQILFDQKKLGTTIVDSSIKILIDSGYIENKDGTQSQHQVHILLSPRQIHSFIKNFANVNYKDLLVTLARDFGGNIFRNFVRIDLHRLSIALEESESDIIMSLKQLSQGGIIEYDSPSLFPKLNLTVPRVHSILLKLDLEKPKALIKNLNNKLDKILNYTNTSDCRMAYILNYFGERTEGYKCGKCDNCTCNTELESSTLEYVEESILQTIHESTFPIKKKTLFQILTGQSDLPSLTNFSTFGTCTHFKEKEIETSLEHLINNKFVIKKHDSFILSENGIQHFAHEKIEEQTATNYEEDLQIFNILRQIRKESSEKFGQAPHLICSDEILRQIIKVKPKTHSELLSISGFTQRMFNKIGEEILNVFRNHNQEKNNVTILTGTSLQILELVERKYSIDDILKISKLPESLLIFQLEGIIKLMPHIDISGLVNLKEQKQIIDLIDNGITEIRQIREILKNKVSNSKIRLVIAKKNLN